MLVLAAASVIAVTARAAAEPSAVDTRRVASVQLVPEDRALADLLVVDGGADIRGVVRGHVYAIDSEVVVRSTAVVLESITQVRGTLTLEPGAVLPPIINLTAAKLEGVEAPDRDRIELHGGATVIQHERREPDAARLALMKRFLPFDRFAPPEHLRARDLNDWHPGLGLELRRSVVDPKEVVIGGVARLSFVSDKVEGAFQRGYSGPRGSVILTVVRLRDEPIARALWSEVERAGAAVRLPSSLETGLGEGAHWYFQKGSRHTMTWQRGPWFLAVETRFDGERASVHQQMMLLEQVLSSLEGALSRATGALGVGP